MIVPPQKSQLVRARHFTTVKRLSSRTLRVAREIVLRGSAIALVLCALFGFNPQTLAATDMWVGNTTANWADVNWSGGNNPPQTGDSLTFGAAGSQGATLTDNLMTPATFSVAGITFNAGAAAFIINSGTAGVNGFTLTGGIANAGTALETINDAILLNATQTFTTNSGGGNLAIGGAISGAGGVTIAGAGTLTLSGSNSYTGTTTAAVGTMDITGYLGTSGTPSGGITIGSNTTTSATLNLTNATINAASLSLDQGTSSSGGTYDLTIAGGTTTLTGLFAVNALNADGTGLATFSSGTLSAGSVTVGRDKNSFAGTLQTAGHTTNGLYIDGGALTVTTTLNDGGSANSSASMDLASGSVTVGGLTTISNDASARYALLSITGGTYTASGGIQLGGVSDTGAEDVELLLTSGTLSTSGIAFAGNPGGGAGTEELLATGGAIYIGSGGITVGTGGTLTMALGNSSTAPLVVANASFTSSVNMTLGSVAPTFQTADSFGDLWTMTLNGVLSGSGGLNQTGGGTLTLGGVNTYTGPTSIPASNTLTIAGAGSLGSGSYAGNIVDSGTFSYGSSATQTLSGVLSGAGALIQNGPGTLSLAGPDTYTGTLAIAGGTLAISGAGSLDSGSYAGNIPDAGTLSFSSSASQTLSGAITGVGGLTVTSGTLTLSGANGYTGATSIHSGGELAIGSAGSLGETAITVLSGGTLLAQAGSGDIDIGSSLGTLTLNPGSTFSMEDGSIGTVTLDSAGGSGTTLTLGGTTSSPANLIFDIGSTGADQLIVANGTVSFSGGSPQNDIVLSPAGGAPGSLSDILLLSVPNGILVLGDFSIAPTVSLAGIIYDASLSLNGADNELLVSLSGTGSANYYFTGAQSASWSTLGNFATDHTGGAAQSALPTTTSNVFLTADTASSNPTNYESETLDGNYTINSLSFTGTDSAVGNTPAATNPILLASGTGTTLTIAAANEFADANGNNYAKGIGLVVQAGSAAHTISADIDLGGNQTWEIDNSTANPLTVSGVIADGTTLNFLTKTGAGTLIFTNANTYDGGTIVSGGTLMLGTGGSLAPTGTLIVNGTGTFDLAGNSQTVANISDGGVSTGIITSSTGAATLLINNTTPNTYSGAINDNGNSTNGGSVALVLEGSSTVTLSGSSNFTGGTSLGSGNLTVANNYALGNPASTNANAGLLLDPGSGTVNAYFTSANPTIAALNNAGTGTGNVILGNTVTPGATTLNVGPGNAGGSFFSGVISDRSATNAAAVGNLNVYGGANLTLIGANTFTGTTTVTGAGTILTIYNPLALQDSTLNFNNQGGTLAVDVGSMTLAGLTGSETLSLTGADGGVALSLGNNNVTSTFNGILTDGGAGGSITVVNGNVTLTGANSYTGGTTVTGGILTLTNALGSIGTPSGSITADAATVNATLDLNGVVVYGSSLTEDSGPGSGNAPQNFVNIGQNGTGATIVLSGALAVDANNGDQNSPLSLFSGTVTANSASIGRGNSSQGGTPGLLGTTADGIYVDGGALNITTTLAIGATQASSAVMRMDSGSVTVGGVTTITNGAASRFSVLDINGGTFTDNDTSGTGILVGGNTDANALDAELLIEGGVLNTPAITLGGTAQTSGIDEFLATGGTTTIGSGGIINGNPTGTTLTISLGFSTDPQSTVPTIAASASWSSAVPVTLTNSTGNVTPIFQTATGKNITLSGGLSGTGGLTATGSGILTLSGASSYSGITTIDGGILSLGGASPLGATSAVTFAGGTLQYSSGSTTDYSSLFANSASPISIDTNGANVTFNSPFASSNTGGLNVVDSAGGGSLTLTQANTYTAPTTIGAGGKLALASTASLGDTAITVSNGGTLLAEPGSGGNIQIGATAASLTLNAGSSFSMANGAIGTLTLNAVGGGGATLLTLGGTTSSPVNMTFDLGSTGADELIVNNGAVSFASSAQDNIVLIPAGSAPGTLTDIPLLSVPNGVLSIGDFSPSTPSITLGGVIYNTSLSIGGPGGDTELFVSLSSVGSANYYFTGNSNSSWSTVGNFSIDHTGVGAQSTALAPLDNVFLTADTASNYTPETVDGNYTINSLSFTGTDSAVGNTPAANAGITLAAGTATQPLVITGSNSFADTNGKNYAKGIGLVVQVGSAAHTISTSIDLGNSQTWEIDGSNPLTVSGVIGDGTTLDSLTKTGAGTLILANNNTYDGGTIVTAGTVALGITNALEPTVALTVNGAGTFDLAGFNQTLSTLSDGGVTSGTITSSTGSATLTLENASPLSFGGSITDDNGSNGSSLALALIGPSSVKLSGSSSYTGGTTVTSGTLIASSNHALGSSSSPTGGLLLNPSTTGTATVDFTSGAPSIAALASSVTGTTSFANVVLGNSSTDAQTTLTVGGGGAATNFYGAISDKPGAVATAIGNLVVSGGSLTLNGTDTFGGTTVISGGSLILGNTNALEDSTVNYNTGGGTLSFGTLTAATLGGLEGNEGIALVNTSVAPVALTIGNNGGTAVYSGVLSDAGLGGSLTVAGGTVTLSNTNTYIGTTTITKGTTTISASGAIGTSGTYSGAVTVTSGTFVINGGSVYAPSLTQNDTAGAATVSLTGNGTISLTGNLGVNGSNGDGGAGLVSLVSGTLTAASATVGRDGDNLGAGVPTSASTTDGLYVDGGTLIITGSGTLGVGTQAADNSSAQMRVDAGTVTVGGITTVTNNASGRFSVLGLNGGTFTDNDTTGIGILVGGNAGTGALDAELLIRGTAIVNTPAITVGTGVETGGMLLFTDVGGTTNIGSGGIVLSAVSPTVATIDLGSGSVATAPLIAASATWSSSAPMTLANSSGGIAVTFQTATGSNITLSGPLTGTGGLTAAGTGALTLSGTNSYTGVTTVNAGAVIVTGSLTATTSVSVASAAHLEVDGMLNKLATTTVGGFLRGVGTVGPVNVSAGGILHPGLVAGVTPVAGALTALGPLTFTDDTSEFSIRLGVASPGDSDQLIVGAAGTGYAVTLNNADLVLTLGSAFEPQSMDSIYVLINEQTAASGEINGEFEQGSTITDADGDIYDILYNVNSLGAGGGSDVDLELVGVIPEPGTWPMMLGGLGILIFWQRSRRAGRRDL